MTDDLLALYRDAANAAERTCPPMSETVRRRLVDVAARRRKAA
jgi:hypothetical protein